MRNRKRALHLAVTAGMLGGLVTAVTASPAGAVVLPASPESCAIVLQGPDDPTAGNLPPGLLPLGWNGQDYILAGEVTKGDGSKIISNLRTPTAGATRFSASLTINQTPVLTQIVADTTDPDDTLSANSTTAKIGWKNDNATGSPGLPTLQVFEAGKIDADGPGAGLPVATKVSAIKGQATGLSNSKSNQGASIGGVTVGTLQSPTFTTSIQTVQLNIARGVNDGDFTINTFLSGTPLPFGPFDWDDSDAVIGGTMEATLDFVLGPLAPFSTISVTETQAATAPSVTFSPSLTMNPGTDRVLKITITEAGAPTNPLAGSTLTFEIDHDVLRGVDDDGAGPHTADDVVGTTLLPANAVVSAGGIWSNNQSASEIGATGTYDGDPAVSVVADLGNNPKPFPAPGNGGPGSENVYTMGFIYSNGVTGGVGTDVTNPANMPDLKGANKGKVGFVPDSQATIAVFSKDVIRGLNPNPEGNISALTLTLASAQPQSLWTPSNETCTLSSLLGLFCVANPTQIPAAFSSFCSGLGDPENSSPSAPPNVVGSTNLTSGVDVTFDRPVYAVDGIGPAANCGGSPGITQCDDLTGYEFRATDDGKVFSPWTAITGGMGLGPLANASQTVNLPQVNVGVAPTGTQCTANKKCIYQVRATSPATSPGVWVPVPGFNIPIDGVAGSTLQTTVK